jgi:hypothetical protein
MWKAALNGSHGGNLTALFASSKQLDLYYEGHLSTTVHAGFYKHGKQSTSGKRRHGIKVSFFQRRKVEQHLSHGLV